MSRASASRRRRNSLYVPLATGLMLASTLTGVVALTNDAIALSSAAAAAVGCGWVAVAALRTELTRQCSEAAKVRARQARRNRALLIERADSHATFALAMQQRLRERERRVHELEGTLRLSEARAIDAESRVRTERSRALAAQNRITELEVALAIRTAEEADELATWSLGPADNSDFDTVVDLFAWDQRKHA